jgi:hypothetical protein
MCIEQDKNLKIPICRNILLHLPIVFIEKYVQRLLGIPCGETTMIKAVCGGGGVSELFVAKTQTKDVRETGSGSVLACCRAVSTCCECWSHFQGAGG